PGHAANFRAAARRGQDWRGGPRAEEARRAYTGRVRADEAAHRERREHHAPGFAAEKYVAVHRAAPRAYGRPRVSVRLAGAADSADGAHYWGVGYAGCHDTQP